MGSFPARKGDGNPAWRTLWADSRSFSWLRRASWSREKDLGKDEPLRGARWWSSHDPRRRRRALPGSARAREGMGTVPEFP